jgi:hypothetical protein
MMTISSEVSQRGKSVRGYFAATCVVLGIVALTLGVLLAYASRVVFNSEAFADRVAASLAHPGVAALIADRVTDGLIAKQRDLTAFGPIISGATRALVASEPFRGIVRRAARTSHEAVMSGRAKRMLLNVADVGVILHSALSTHPELAKKIPPKISALVGNSDEAPGGQMAVDVMRVARRSRLSALALIVFGVGMSVLGLMLSPARRTTLFRLAQPRDYCAGVALDREFGGEVLAHLARDPAVGRAVAGLWSAFLGGFMTWALILGAISLVLAAAVNSLFERVKLAEMGNAFWRWLTIPPSGKGAQVWRGMALLAVGLLASLAPSATLTILALLAGLVVAFIGLRELFRLLLRALPQAEFQKIVAGSFPEERSLPFGRVVLIGAAAVVLIGIGIFSLTRTAATAAAPQSIDACNGYPELCDRRLNEVVFPASHNSMAAADIPNWLFPNHEKSIPAQLNDGIRALLIDVHYGVPVGDKIKTHLEDEGVARKKYEAALGKEGVDAAMRIRDRLIGGDEGERGMYLCHGFCELGASAFVPMLAQIREFLVANPNEVLIIVIQDEGVTPPDIEKCFQESGLIDFVYRGAAAPPWPTLREMVASDQRVVVMTENNSEGVVWIHPAFQVMQETPYSFHRPEEFSCKPNRGGDGASLFLINHWIETAPAPLPSNAEIVNAYDFLLKRAQQCQKERRHLPNIIAVDFYHTGDVVGVARTLNGINSSSAIAEAKASEGRLKP